MTGTRYGKLDGIMSARALFLCGSLCLPAFLFQQDLAIRAFQVLFMLALCFLMGRKMRILTLGVLCAGIMASNLVIPSGRVIAVVLGLRVTDAAFRVGITKATAVAGMMALSKISIRPDLELPGRLGGLIGRCLMYFERIMANRPKLRREAFIEGIDAVLEATYAAPDAGLRDEGVRIKTTPMGFAVLALFLASNWIALAVSIAFPVVIWHR